MQYNVSGVCAEVCANMSKENSGKERSAKECANISKGMKG
jgi:hypothetical protein